MTQDDRDAALNGGGTRVDHQKAGIMKSKLKNVIEYIALFFAFFPGF